MKRFAKFLIMLSAVFMLSVSLHGGEDDRQDIPVPSARQLKWHEAELGVIFHYDLHVFDGKAYGQEENRITPVEDYNIFNPRHLDTDQWVRAAKAAGARFAILTATHETGFGLWQSDVNPYCLKAVRWRDGKGDVVADFVASCRKYGVQPGLYIGIRWNSLLGIHNFEVEGSGDFAGNRQQWYRRYCERMVEELCSRYGNLFMVWFDGGADDPRGLGPDVEPIVDSLQPDCLFYHNIDRADLRWGGSETGTVGYPCWSTFPYPYSHNRHNESVQDYNRLLAHGDPEGAFWVPAMADTPLRGASGRHEWFWEPGDEEAVYSLDQLMDIYEKSVGRNATLVVGLAPDPDGLLPEGDVQRLEEWGKEIALRYGRPVACVKGDDYSFILELPSSVSVDRCVVGENISLGERIRSFRIEAMDSLGEWQTVYTGSSVGHKHIAIFSHPVKTTALRLSVDSCRALPHIAVFSAYEEERK